MHVVTNTLFMSAMGPRRGVHTKIGPNVKYAVLPLQIRTFRSVTSICAALFQRLYKAKWKCRCLQLN